MVIPLTFIFGEKRKNPIDASMKMVKTPEKSRQPIWIGAKTGSLNSVPVEDIVMVYARLALDFALFLGGATWAPNRLVIGGKCVEWCATGCAAGLYTLFEAGKGGAGGITGL
jgi:hypothetical protein